VLGNDRSPRGVLAGHDSHTMVVVRREKHNLLLHLGPAGPGIHVEVGFRIRISVARDS
jgi:hypothetical protein